MGAVMMSGLMASCSDDDDDVSQKDVPTAVKQTFAQMFPNAKSVDWELTQGYYVADFNVNTFDTEAWYQSNGTWAMTETDYDSLVTMLPIAVQTAFNQSQYSSWIVDDAYVYERPGDSFVLIEVETSGMPEIGLFYDMSGDLLNKVQGFDFNITPTTQPESLTFQ